MVFSIFIALLLSLATLTGAQGVDHVGNGKWDDFANNLAADLAPLLALFGEQPTKQFLSESINMFDYIIFALGPIGIITILTSIIRVRGGPALRAFIGRSQEGMAIPEAELCSSVGGDICELFVEGGVARLFGRPKILELIYNTRFRNKPGRDTGAADRDHDDKVIFTFDEFYNKQKGMDEKEWTSDESSANPLGEIESGTAQRRLTPNLTLNVGIRPLGWYLPWSIIIVGFVLQAGVVAFAVTVVHYLKWPNGDAPTKAYALPVMIFGTCLLTLGVFLCAQMIGSSTQELTYYRLPIKTLKDGFLEWKRKRSPGGQTRKYSPMYWMQPGDQNLADQVFGAFLISDSDSPRPKYVRSWKTSRDAPWAVGLVIITTVTGFTMQFVGLRGLHSSVSLAQLGLSVSMSILRSMFRSSRLKADTNLLGKQQGIAVGHELECLAMRMVGEEHGKVILSFEPPLRADGKRAVFLMDPTENQEPTSARSRDENKLAASQKPSEGSTQSTDRVLQPGHGNLIEDLVRARVQLDDLTRIPLDPGQFEQSCHFRDTMIFMRKTAFDLCKAMEKSLSDLFAASQSNVVQLRADFVALPSSPPVPLKISWNLSCSAIEKDETQHQGVVRLDFKISRGHSELLDKRKVEAILGLWMWSLVSDKRVCSEKGAAGRMISEADTVGKKIILATSAHRVEEMRPWLPQPIQEMPVTDKLDSFPIGSQMREGSWLYTPGSNEAHEGAPNREISASASSKPPLMALFGWHAVSQEAGKEQGDYRVLCQDSKARLKLLCARHIFGAFIYALMEHVESVRGIKVQTSDDEKLVHLSCDFLHETTRSFIDAGLGTEKEALQCIMPSVLPKVKSPAWELVASEAMTKARINRRSGNWRSCGDVLLWAWRTCNLLSRPKAPVSNEPRPGGSTPGETHTGRPLGITASESSAYIDLLVAACEHYRNSLADREKWDDCPDDYASKGLEQLGASFNSRSAKDHYKASFKNRIEYTLKVYSEVLSRISIDGLKSSRDSAGIDGVSGLIQDDPDIGRFRTRSSVLACLTQARLKPLTNPQAPKREDLLVRFFACDWAEAVLALLELEPAWDLERDKDKNGRAILHQAAHPKCAPDTIRMLLQAGASPDVADDDGALPLHLAIRNGNATTVKILLQVTRDRRACDKKGWDPLAYAVAGNQVAIVRFLMDQQTEFVGEICGQRRRWEAGRLSYPLTYTFEKQHWKVFMLLLGHSRLSLEKHLYMAAEDEQTDLIRYLLEEHSEINIHHYLQGRVDTALRWAAAYDCDDMAHILIAHGADPNRRDDDGNTVIDYAPKESRSRQSSLYSRLRKAYLDEHPSRQSVSGEEDDDEINKESFFPMPSGETESAKIDEFVERCKRWNENNETRKLRIREQTMPQPAKPTKNGYLYWQTALLRPWQR